MTYLSGKAGSLDLDALLQDSYLLVVTLHQGAPLEQIGDLWAKCTEQLEHTRRRLGEAGLSERSIDMICYAQCALLDETVLGRAQGEAHAQWAARPLQAHFFKRHEAGVQVYEDMREVLAEPAPDRSLLTCYQRMLLMGFQGCYRGDNAAPREQLLAALSERVGPFSANPAIGGLLRQRRSGVVHWLGSPWLHVTAACLLLAGLWLGFDHSLANAIGQLLLARG